MRCSLSELEQSAVDATGNRNQTAPVDLAAALFHRVNRVLPQAQQLQTASPNCKIRDAIQLMSRNHFSQLPVVADGKIIGVFTYRKFAQFVARTDADQWRAMDCEPGELTVDHCLEKFAFVALTDEMESVFDLLDRDGAALVGTAERPHGILSGIDLARYLHEIAGPFVLILEIELCLRALMLRQLSSERIAAAAVAALGGLYKGREHKLPKTLEEMTFDNYRSIIVHPEYWPVFEALFGVMRRVVDAKLSELADLRNDVFHFKRDLQIQEHETLAAHRDWFLSRATQARLSPGDQNA